MEEFRVDQCMNAPNVGSELQDTLVRCISKEHDCAELNKRAPLLQCAITG